MAFEFIMGDNDSNYNNNNKLPNESLEPIGWKERPPLAQFCVSAVLRTALTAELSVPSENRDRDVVEK